MQLDWPIYHATHPLKMVAHQRPQNHYVDQGRYHHAHCATNPRSHVHWLCATTLGYSSCAAHMNFTRTGEISRSAIITEATVAQISVAFSALVLAMVPPLALDPPYGSMQNCWRKPVNRQHNNISNNDRESQVKSPSSCQSARAFGHNCHRPQHADPDKNPGTPG